MYFKRFFLNLMAVIPAWGVIDALEQKNVAVKILNLEMDTNTPTGKLILTVLVGVAQFEREIMLECQREGVAKAKMAGKYKGRKPIAEDRQQEVLRLAAEGLSKAHIAKQVGIGEATVFRILKLAKKRCPFQKQKEIASETEKKIKFITLTAREDI